MVICYGTSQSINNSGIVKRALPVSFSVKEIALYKGRRAKGKAWGGEGVRERSARAGEAEVVSTISATCHYLNSLYSPLFCCHSISSSLSAD